jgi:hypothetical protein
VLTKARELLRSFAKGIQSTPTYTRSISILSSHLKLKQSRTTPWRRLEERRYSSYSFTTSTLDGGEWSASRPGRALPREKDLGTQWTGGWVGPRAGLDTEARGKILCLWRGSNPDRPVVQPVARHYTDWATRLTILPSTPRYSESLFSLQAFQSEFCILYMNSYFSSFPYMATCLFHSPRSGHSDI